MDERKGPESYEDLTKALACLFEESGPLAPEEVDEILIEAGYDPSSVAEHMSTVAKQAIQDSPLNWRNRALMTIRDAQARLASLQRPEFKARDEIIQSIQELIQRIGEEQIRLVGAHFRNLEQASDDDLASLLSQLEYLVAQQADRASDSEE